MQKVRQSQYQFICRNETVMHVCSKYSDIRNNLFEAISKFVVNFDTLSLEEKFLMLLSSQQSEVNLLVVDYVNKCFEVRVMHQE